MIWGVILFYGVSDSIVLNGKRKAKSNTLESGLLPFCADVFGEIPTWVFQQDSCPIQTAKKPLEWLWSKSFRTIARFKCSQVQCSQVLKIIDNVWELMTRKICKRNQELQDVKE